MNPNLNRNEAYFRSGKRMYSPVHPQFEVVPSDDNPTGVPHPHAGMRTLEKQYDSISAAKRRSRELMKLGKIIVTKES